MQFEVKDILLPLLAGFSAISWWAISTSISRLLDSLERMTVSVQSLTVKMAVVVDRVELHENRLTRLERNKGSPDG